MNEGGVTSRKKSGACGFTNRKENWRHWAGFFFRHKKWKTGCHAKNQKQKDKLEFMGAWTSGAVFGAAGTRGFEPAGAEHGSEKARGASGTYLGGRRGRGLRGRRSRARCSVANSWRTALAATSYRGAPVWSAEDHNPFGCGAGLAGAAVPEAISLRSSTGTSCMNLDWYAGCSRR